jgi:hypothetical protein
MYATVRCVTAATISRRPSEPPREDEARTVRMPRRPTMRAASSPSRLRLTMTVKREPRKRSP